MMMRPLSACMLVALIGIGTFAQVPAPARFRWPADGALVYRISYSTQQTHVLNEDKSEAKSDVKVTRRWKVLAVDTAGTATLQMSLTSMVQHRTSASGTEWKFDSADPKSGTPEMREAMLKHLNTPLATLRVDALGKVVEVRDTKTDASAYENELPFHGVLPGSELKAGTAWTREFKLTLAPPLGTGEKYDAIQKFVCKSVVDGKAIVSVVTELKTKPKAAADIIPLWQMLPKGELSWDLKTGRLLNARLVVEEELKGHEGAGSSTRFTSVKTVELIGDK